MKAAWKAIDVLQMSGSNFQLSPAFDEALRRAHNPFIVLFVGNARAGKTTRANQLLTHQLEDIGPFEAASGLDPVTMGCQFVNPVTFAKLSQIHNIILDVPTNPEVFLIDCEGLNSLGHSTQSLKRAIFALAQLASLVIIVTMELNFGNLPHLHSLMQMSSILRYQNYNFAAGVAIMVREIGVQFTKGASMEEQNKIRQAQDASQREKVIREWKLTDSTQKKNLIVLAQPQWITPELYWESINDLLCFARGIALQRPKVSGSTLLSLFDAAKKYLVEIQNLDDPSIPFTTILAEVARRCMTGAKDEVLQGIDANVKQRIHLMTSAYLKSTSPDRIAETLGSEFYAAFDMKSNKAYPDAIQSYPAIAREFKMIIQERVTSQVEVLVIDRWITDFLNPAVTRAEVAAGSTIQTAGENILPETGRTFSYLDLQNRVFSEVEKLVCDEMKGMPVKLNTKCEDEIKNLRRKIIIKIESLQKQKNSEYDSWKRAEDEKQKRECGLNLAPSCADAFNRRWELKRQEAESQHQLVAMGGQAQFSPMPAFPEFPQILGSSNFPAFPGFKHV
jgi:hypothetical protein